MPTIGLGFNFRAMGNWIFICFQAKPEIGLDLKSCSVKFGLDSRHAGLGLGKRLTHCSI